MTRRPNLLIVSRFLIINYHEINIFCNLHKSKLLLLKEIFEIFTGAHDITHARKNYFICNWRRSQTRVKVIGVITSYMHAFGCVFIKHCFMLYHCRLWLGQCALTSRNDHRWKWNNKFKKCFFLVKWTLNVQMTMNYLNKIFLTLLLATLAKGFPQKLSDVARAVKETEKEFYSKEVEFSFQ